MKRWCVSMLICLAMMVTLLPGNHMAAWAEKEHMISGDAGFPLGGPHFWTEESGVETPCNGEDDEFGHDLIRKHGDFHDATINGISYSWDHLKCHIWGTASSQSIYTLIDSRTRLPEGMNPGDCFYLQFSPSHETYRLRYWIAFWARGNTKEPIEGSTVFSFRSNPIVVPDNAVGVTVQLRVPGETEINETVDCMELVKMRPQKINPAHIVTFVDDDTSGWDYVEKYHDACRHNGVYGNYAVLTKYSEDGFLHRNGKSGPEMRQLLLDYEREGFGMLIHGYRQSSDDPWQIMGTDPEKIAICRNVVEKGLQQMGEWGFTDYHYWITPYGVRGYGPRRIAEDLNLTCLISTNNGRYNSMQDYDRLFIKRVALRQDDNGDPFLCNTMEDVKNAIDTCAQTEAGWLIITTHFNEWSGLEWDETVDEKGYPVGYGRFNEMVQYALHAGLTPMTFSQAWDLYEPILEANRVLAVRAHEEWTAEEDGHFRWHRLPDGTEQLEQAEHEMVWEGTNGIGEEVEVCKDCGYRVTRIPIYQMPEENKERIQFPNGVKMDPNNFRSVLLGILSAVVAVLVALLISSAVGSRRGRSRHRRRK